MSDVGAATAATPESDLKARIFAAFEHACRFGEVEVADQLLAIINSKWMKQPKALPHQAPAAVPRQASARPLRLTN
jgi:hypothetical protein